MDVKFALPTLPHSDLPTSGQHGLLSQQATAVIVAAYLEHSTAMFQGYIANDDKLTANRFSVDRDQIDSLIDRVQRALRYTGD